MKKKYCVSPLRFSISLATCITALVITSVQIFLREWTATVLFGCISAIFLVMVFINGSSLVVSEKGISRYFACIPLLFLPWSEIQEVGIVNTRVLGSHRPNSGPRYIYFSPNSLAEEERFQLALKWPPLKIPYMSYTQERFASVQLFWSGIIEFYPPISPESDST